MRCPSHQNVKKKRKKQQRNSWSSHKIYKKKHLRVIVELFCGKETKKEHFCRNVERRQSSYCPSAVFQKAQFVSSAELTNCKNLDIQLKPNVYIHHIRKENWRLWMWPTIPDGGNQGPTWVKTLHLCETNKSDKDSETAAVLRGVINMQLLSPHLLTLI